jgi:hypothetical protein
MYGPYQRFSAVDGSSIGEGFYYDIRPPLACPTRDLTRDNKISLATRLHPIRTVAAQTYPGVYLRCRDFAVSSFPPSRGRRSGENVR